MSEDFRFLIKDFPKLTEDFAILTERNFGLSNGLRKLTERIPSID